MSFEEPQNEAMPGIEHAISEATRKIMETLIPGLLEEFPIRILSKPDEETRSVTDYKLHIDVPRYILKQFSYEYLEGTEVPEGKGKGKAKAVSEDDPEWEPPAESDAGVAVGDIGSDYHCFECEWRRRMNRERSALLRDDE